MTTCKGTSYLKTLLEFFETAKKYVDMVYDLLDLFACLDF